MSNSASAIDFDLLIDGTEVPDADVLGFVCDLDLDQPGMCMATMRNKSHDYNDKWKPGASVELKIGGGTRYNDDNSGSGGKATVFKGELVGIEPNYRQGGESRISIRAYDKLHRLLRGRKSKTYQDQSDQDICSAIAGQAGLSAQCGSSPKITHKHVYQHNQTNLEFLRVRAKRLGFNVWVEDTKLYFDAPKLDKDSGIEFVLDKQAEGKLKLMAFSGRLSNAHVMKKVTVRGWDPEQKKEIVGEVSAASSPLGSKNAAASLSDFGDIATFCVDYPIFSVEEAKAIAKAKLDEASLGYLTAEAEAHGDNRVKPGIVVKIKVNLTTATDRFNGKYLVTGVTHRLMPGVGSAGGNYNMVMRLARDAEGGS
jgi:phage protein D